MNECQILAARILIVDDDPALLRALTQALRLRMPKVVVETAGSAPMALDQLDRQDYDAVVTDIKMPGMDGLGLLAEIRALQPELPTLLITGHGQHDLAVQALRGGAFDFIQKPIDRDYFVASLSRGIRVRQLSRQVEAQKSALEQHAAELEQTVAARTRELRESNQKKDEFLAMLAHELRNPLAAIFSAVELMPLCEKDNSLWEETREVIGRQSRHMGRLLDDLLDISRITRSKIELRTEPLDLVDVITDAVQAGRPAIEGRRHRLSVSLPNEPLPVEGDQTRLEQVVVNLLNNASKYTEPGGHIRLTAFRDGHEQVLRVRDNGIGICPSMLPHVFDPFTQADRSLDRSQGGLGIGLTLVRKLVELHGGSTQAQSEGAGQGSTFVVRLPALGSGALESSELDLVDVSPPLRVLLVDDNRTITKMMAALLDKCGHHVVAVASDGLSALEAAAAHEPDVILLDIGLPGMDGYEVARRLRKNRRLNSVLLAAMTGYGQSEDRRRCEQAGFDHHLVKPVSLETLQDLFARHSRLVQQS